MRISDFFETITKPKPQAEFMSVEDSLLGQIVYGFDGANDEAIAKYDVAIIGIGEGKNSVGNNGCAKGVDYIRPALNKLRKTSRSIKIVDLGNIKGKTLNDKYYAIQEVVKILMKCEVFGVFVGGSQDFIMPVIQSLIEVNSETAITIIDPKIDLQVCEADFSAQSYVSYVKEKFEKKIFELNILGVQKYYVGESQENLLREVFWEIVRLGDLRKENISLSEPYLRDAELVSFDVGSIQSDYMPYYNNININGFTGYEACQMAWYSGMSDCLKFFMIQEYNPEHDTTHKGAALCAQMLWHLFEGISLKTNEVPDIDSENYKIFVVHLHNFNEDIRFYTNRVNNRWWIEVPWKESVRMLACSEMEYFETRNGNLPEKWWRFFQKGTLD